jgi:hypothetical protein
VTADLQRLQVVLAPDLGDLLDQLLEIRAGFVGHAGPAETVADRGQHGMRTGIGGDQLNAGMLGERIGVGAQGMDKFEIDIGVDVGRSLVKRVTDHPTQCRQHILCDGLACGPLDQPVDVYETVRLDVSGDEVQPVQDPQPVAHIIGVNGTLHCRAEMLDDGASAEYVGWDAVGAEQRGDRQHRPSHACWSLAVGGIDGNRPGGGNRLLVLVGSRAGRWEQLRQLLASVRESGTVGPCRQVVVPHERGRVCQRQRQVSQGVRK